MKTITIIDHGLAQSTIYIDPMAIEPIRFAAAELQRYLQQITGVWIAVDFSADPPDDAVVLQTDSELADEEYEISCDGSHLRIAGGDGLAVLCGVYQLLRQFGKVEFSGFGPEGEDVPAASTFSVPDDGRWRNKPLHWYRGTQLTCVGELQPEQMPIFREASIRRLQAKPY